MGEIFAAIDGCDFEEVRRIVNEDYENVNVKDVGNWTPLDWSISYGNQEIAQFLFEKGGRPNLEIYCDGKSSTPVHKIMFQTAHVGEQIEILKWTFKENIIPLYVLNIKDEREMTFLDYAIGYGNLEIAQCLWDLGGRPNLEKYRNGEWTPVHSVAAYGRTEILKWVFAEKEVLSLRVLNTKNSDGRTPLDDAIAHGRLEMAKYLWKKGGRPNLEIYYRDGKSSTPVHWIVQDGETDILEWVFTENILPLDVLYTKDWNKLTPLDCAIMWGKLEMALFLFEKGGQPNLEIYCDEIFTPVHKAVQDGDMEILKWIFTENVFSLDVLNIKDDCENTPLDVAIMWGKLETAKYLWEKGGRSNLENYRDGEWNTPVHHAAHSGHATTLKWVFAKGVLPLHVLQIKGRQKMTPLDVAISEKEWETAALLRRLSVDAVFLVMQYVKRDHHQMCVLRRLPDELLDMVVDEVAARLHLKVVW